MRIFIMYILLTQVVPMQAEYTVKKRLTLMGTSFELCAIHPDSLAAEKAIQIGIEEIQRIEELISSHKNSSETSMINSFSGIRPVKISYELYSLIERSKKISTLTDGAFDISFAVTDKLWDFKSGRGKAPEPHQSENLKSLIDYRLIILNANDTSVFLSKKGMRIGFGAIGKGYAANKAKQQMKMAGINSGYVNASGDILFWGDNNGNPWRVGIASPEDIHKPFGWIEINNMAVVTSGDYVFNIKNDTTTLSHIIDPKTALPVTQTRSVTIICPDAELADGLATAVSVLGPATGLELINKLKGIECIIITSDNKLLMSEHVNIIK